MLPLVTMTTRRGREGGAVDFVFDIPVFIKSPRRRHENNPKRENPPVTIGDKYLPDIRGEKRVEIPGKRDYT